MFAIPGIVLLLTAIYARPQELVPSLQTLPLLHVLLGLAVFGYVIDLRLGNTKPSSTPLLPWVLAFVGWGLLSGITKASSLPIQARELAICAALYLLMAHAVQSFRALQVVAGTVLAMVIFVSTVAVEQKLEPTGCVQIDESVVGDTTSGSFDERPCTVSHDCYLGEAEPGAEYMCEHIGWLGTTSVGRGRIRFRGILQDPNELALAGAIGLPLAFALSRLRRRSFSRKAVLLLTFALVVLAAVWSRSRGGQIVFLAVLAVPFAWRFGLRGVALSALFAAPLLLLGGRSGSEADSSMLERVDCWAEALSIWRSFPLLGAGLGQFGRYHYLTAHNSYLLTLAELGPVGMFLFSSLVWMGFKIPISAWRKSEDPDSALSREDARDVVRPWAMAITATFAGLGVGIFFLSFAYHYVLWIYLGLSGALFSAIRRHAPDFAVRYGMRDALGVIAANGVIIAVVYVYTRLVLS